MEIHAQAEPLSLPDLRSAALRLWRRLATPLAVAAYFLVVPLTLLAPVTLGERTLVPFDVLLADPAYAPELSEQVAAPQNELVADLVFENLVWKRFLVEALRDGEVPLWNPYILGGLPFLAAGQHSALYPTTLLFLLLRPEVAFGWSALLALWLAGMGMYAFGRNLRLNRFAALLMGTLWSLGPLMVVNSVFPMIQAAMAWAPVVLAGIESLARLAAAPGPGARLLPRGRAAPWIILTALATALCALAGHVELLYYSALVAVVFALFRIAGVGRDGGRLAALRLSFWLATAAVAGGLLAAVQLVPLAELAATSWRSGAQPYDVVVGYAFGLRQAIGFLIPDFFGNPAHHVVWDIVARRGQALPTHAMWGAEWGTKNYVEAAGYAGLLALLLLAVALVASPHRGLKWFWAALGGVALTFVFGWPTYRLLFFGLPGFDQLHTPFRWTYPLVLSLVVLAGLGADGLTRGAAVPRAVAWIGGTAVLVGGLLATALAVFALVPERWVDLTVRSLGALPGALPAARARFPADSVLASYQYWNLLHLALFLTLAGVTVLLLVRAAVRRQSPRVGMALALGITCADLWLVGYGFNPAVDARLADVRPAPLDTLALLGEVKWGRVVGYGDGRVLWPNSAMRADVPDLRGYDSIIPRWTVETINAIEDQSGMLLYNRIGNLTSPDSLHHPVLAALGGRYILTSGAAPSDPDLALIEDFGGTRLYENRRALERAWLVNTVQVPDETDPARARAAVLGALGSFDPRAVALLEERPNLSLWQDLPSGRQVRPPTAVRFETRARNTLELDVFAEQGGLLVLSEAWFPGWRAWVTVSGADGTREIEVPVYRADGMLRAVPVPSGRSMVRLSYTPMSVKVGLYGSFLGLVLLLLVAAFALWDRFVRVDPADAVGKVAVNSAGPMAAALLNKALDFVFAMLALRLLGPDNAGRYYTAITLIGFADIVSNFGLNLLAVREVGRHPEAAPRYLTHTATLRLLLWLLTLPLLVGYVAFRQASGDSLGADTVLAIALLAGALVPGDLNAAISSIFQATERMVLPAGVSIISTLLKISIGAWVLLAGYGFVGLAGVAIVTNWITFAVLAALLWHHGIRPELALSGRFLRTLTVLAFPLMLSHLLQSVFFKVDVLLLDQFWGPTVVGWYQAAYKWVDALLIIPAYLTMALFPLMSRQAESNREGLRRAHAMGLRWLVNLALPICVATTFLAEDLVRLLAGREYLPHGAQALQIMIWFLPFSFANGLTQYVLIALNRQRWITLSFAVAVAFNIVANLIFIPRYSYSGAAAITIASELVLLVPFFRGLRDLGAPSLLVILWRPALSASVMVLVVGLVSGLQWPLLLGVLAGLPLYLGLLVRLGGVTAEDRALLARLLPRRAGTPAPEPSAPA
jgi:O-antigen/teichoic acid export membrane protein